MINGFSSLDPQNLNMESVMINEFSSLDPQNLNMESP